MKPVESSVVINRPIEERFAFPTDLGNDVDWRRHLGGWISRTLTTLESKTC
jgi:hypothetical protein